MESDRSFRDANARRLAEPERSEAGAQPIDPSRIATVS